MRLKPGQFYGETRQSMMAGAFRFTEKQYSTDSRLPYHSHELSHFCFVLAGNYKERINSHGFERAPSSLVYYPPDTSHAEEHFADGRHFLVEIDAEGLDRVREHGARLAEPASPKDTATLWLAARMYREFIERDPLSELALECISNELLIATSRCRDRVGVKDKRPPKWLAHVKEYLYENSAEPPPLSELAAAAGVHPTHLARVFRRFEQCTPGDLVRRTRIEKARQAMISSDETLVEIAIKIGFADQAHFTRSFKQFTGMTPSEFQRIFKQR